MWPNLLAPALAALLAAPPDPHPTDAEAKTAMIAALAVTVAAQPLLASGDAFRDPANARAVNNTLGALLVLRHTFYQPNAQASTERELMTLYARQVERAKQSYLRGESETARVQLRSVTRLCLGCHIRRPDAPKLEAAAAMVDALKLEPLERASSYAAMRQFDRALDLWRETLRHEARTDAEVFEHVQAWRVALDVAVRGKDDPRAALALIEALDERDDFPEFVLVQLDLARKEVRDWNAEQFAAAKAKPDQLMAKARALVELSGAAKTPAAVDRHFVALLRAAGYLDEALQRAPNAPWRGEALYLLGVVSTSINEPLLWQLESLYLEACIRENSGEALARQCYARLYTRALYNYSGAADIPAEEVGWLSVLRALSP